MTSGCRTLKYRIPHRGFWDLFASFSLCVSHRIIGSLSFFFVLLSCLAIKEVSDVMNVFVGVGKQRPDRLIRESMAFWSVLEIGLWSLHVDIIEGHVDIIEGSLTDSEFQYFWRLNGFERT